MGKLRKEPKVKPLLSDDAYRDVLNILKDAMGAAKDNYIYYDLEPSEKPSKVRKAFLYVAEKENLPVAIRRERGSNSLCLSFKDPAKALPARMSAEESRQRILKALSTANGPLQKSEIINTTGISPSTWNIRIKELMDKGRVVRTGDRRDTKYSLAS